MVSQRLVRRVCDACREQHPPDPSVADLIRRESPDAPYSILTCWGRDCPECRFTGYSGRHAIFEILPMSDSLRAMVTARAPSTEIMKRAIEQGMPTLRESGWRCVLDGSTTVEDILRVTPRP